MPSLCRPRADPDKRNKEGKMKPSRRAPVAWALLAIVSLTGVRGSLAQPSGDIEAALDPDKKVATLEEWDKTLDVVNRLRSTAGDAAQRLIDFSGKPFDMGWEKYVLLPEAKEKLDVLHIKAKQAADAGDTKALNAALHDASAALADQKTRAVLLLKYGSILSSLSYHELVLEPWLERGAASDRAFANEQSRAAQQSLLKVIDEALRSSSPLETWSKKFLQPRNAIWGALNAERGRLVKEQAALPNPIPIQAYIRDKSCPKPTAPLPPSGDKATLAPGFPSAENYYPKFAKAAGMEGAVVVRVLVSDTGCAERAEVATTSGAVEMDGGALALALDGKYIPRAKQGAALPGEVVFKVAFQLED